MSAASSPVVQLTIESSPATSPSAHPTVFAVELREDSIEPERAWMVGRRDVECDTEIVIALCGGFDEYRKAVELALADADEDDVLPSYAPALGMETR